MRLGTVHSGGAVMTGEGVGATVAVGPGDGVITGEGVGIAVKLGRPGPTAVPPMSPARIGKEADALTSMTLPRTWLMNGVISENWQVTDTITGDPRVVPFGKDGPGAVPGMEQLVPWASELISRWYSARTAGSVGDWKPC